MTDNSEKALFNSFFQDSDVFILEINRDLMELEKSPQKGELVDRIFRAAHSLKSEADYLNQGEIAAMAHRIEGALEAIRSSHGIPTRGQFDEFFSCIDRIQEMLDQLKQEKLNKDVFENGTGLQEQPIGKEDSPVTSKPLSPS